MPVENTRINQTAPLLADQISDGDLILISDVSAGITKHSTAGQYRTYITNNIYSGSTSVPTSSISVSSSFAAQAANSVSASSAVTSSHSITASYALVSTTASFALNASVDSGTTLTTGSFYPINTSRSITGSNADTASHALNLVYAGLPNGTASFAISSSFSSTASYVTIGGQVEITASWAENVIQAETASHIYYDGSPNGTASYAVDALNATTATQASRISKGELKGYSIFGPYTSSINAGNHSPSGSFTTGSFEISHDNDATLPAEDKNSQVWITATGVVSSSWTGSSDSAPAYAPRQISLSTYCFDTSTFEHVETTDINTHIMGTGASSLSGSTISQFIVTGLADISGSYRIVVSGIDGVRFDDNRPVYFRLESNGQNFRFTDQP